MHKRTTYNKGAVFVLALFIGFFLSILLAAALMRANWESRTTIGEGISLNALYVAEAGLARAIDDLRTTPPPNPGDPALNLYTDIQLRDGNEGLLGTYSVIIYPFTTVGIWPVIPVRAMGKDASGEYERWIDARVVSINPGIFFIFSPYDLRISSGSNINGDIFGRDIAFNIIPYGGNIQVGDVYYTRNTYSEDDPTVSHGDLTLTNPLPFASVDFDNYTLLANKATGGNGAYYTANTSFSGTLSTTSSLPGGQTANNGIIFVNGDVTIDNDLIIDDSAFSPLVIVATGNITIKGDVRYADARNKVGLFSGGNIYIDIPSGSNLEINAQIIAEGKEIRALGDPGLLGTLTFNGAMAVKGEELGVTEIPGQKTAINLVAFANRTYNYDTNLVSGSMIPGMSLISSLLEWKEVPKGSPAP